MSPIFHEHFFEADLFRPVGRRRKTLEQKAAPNVRCGFAVTKPLGCMCQPTYVAGALTGIIGTIIYNEGPQVVSIDDAGDVRATPDNHIYTQRLWGFEPHRVIGRYDNNSKLGYIYVDLRDKREELRRAL